MSEQFVSAVDWLEGQLRPVAEAGFLISGHEPFTLTRDELLVRAEIGYWHFGNERVPNVLTENQAARLFELCESRRGAFDMARHAAASYIHRGWSLPEGLKIFATLYLGGQLQEPKIERRDKTFFRRFFLYFYCYWTARLYPELRMTRGDATRHAESACDAVQAALARCRVHVSERALRDICVGTHETERSLRHWVEDEFIPAVGRFWSRNEALQVDPMWKNANFPVMNRGA